jgi:hypothetical protein
MIHVPVLNNIGGILFPVTEIEIREGILTVDDPASQSAVFSRDITGFSDFEDVLTMRFIDTARKNGKVLKANTNMKKQRSFLDSKA